MLCEECHLNEATVHLTQVVDGRVTKLHLCEECAEARGFDVQTGEVDLEHVMESFKAIHPSASSSPASGPERAPRRKPGTAVCPECGMTLAALQKKGRLGCETCYETFMEAVAALVATCQHSGQHTGKIPRRSPGGLKVSVEVNRLRHDLEKAVAGEKYEEAARLRDRIHELTQDTGGEGAAP